MFSMRKFLYAHWADEDKLHAFLRAYDAPPLSKGGVRKWFERSAIPGVWFATLVMLLEIENGAPISLIPYRQ